MYKKNYFNFRRYDDEYLITNDLGEFSFLSQKNFNKLLKNEKLPSKLEKELIFNKFIFKEKDDEFVQYASQNLKEYKGYIRASTVLHIFVVSKNCNYNCLYCQAGKLEDKDDCFMTKEIAQKSVDIALESPYEYLTFEFQGGEPLTNFEIIKYIVEYSKEKNKKLNKQIEYNIVSNLSLLTDEMVSFISQNNIYVCTSIDGNEKLHNLNRPFRNSNSYIATVNGLKKLFDKNINVSALLTTTRYSFEHYKEIVDEYKRLNLNRICIRPLTKLGKADSNWEKIGYTAEEFVEFYKNTLDYIIKVNKKGYFLVEGMASILLAKILFKDPVNYMELRSPCGGSIGQLAYYYDGNIFTCDEGRMLYEMGDNKFLVGNVFENSFHDLIKSNITCEMCKASSIEGSICCHSCAYLPYCGTCPVLNYSQNGSLEIKSKDNFRCKVNEGMLNILFSYIKNDKKVLRVFYKWLRN